MKLDPIKHTISFKDKGCKAINICDALCCKGWDINLAKEEYDQNIYRAEKYCIEDKKVCDKDEFCSKLAYRLKKEPDGSCIYLDQNNKCTIYSSRPIVCRNFICDNGFKLEPISIDNESVDEDVEFCSFEGQIPSKAKFIFNPFLHLEEIEEDRMIFSDIRSCKLKKVDLAGFDLSLSKKETETFFKQFDGKNSLFVVEKNELNRFSKEDFINFVTYLINEDILIGLFG